MEDYRYCTQVQHNQLQIQFICMHDQCTLPRLLCSQCLFQETHKHNNNDTKHIVTLEILNQIMLTDLGILKKKYQRKQQEFTNLISLMKKQLDVINDSIQLIREGIRKKLALQKTISANKFSLIDEDLLREIIKDKQFSIDNIQMTQLFQSQIIQAPKTQQPQTIQQQISFLQNTNYEVLQIDQQEKENKYQIYTAAMSNNQQFIAVGGSECILKIFNNKILYKNINFQQKITKCKFSPSDQYLYVGIETSIAQISVFDGFQQQKIIQLKNKHILDFTFVTTTELLVVNNKFISKVDFQTQNITLNLLAHYQQIQSIDIYQYRMVSCSQDNSIKLWNHQNGKQLICKTDVCSERIDLRQVKFIQFDQFLCLSNGKIYLFSINMNNTFQKVSLFKSNNYIFQIHFVLEGQLIFLIQDTNVQIISLKGEKIKSIEHKVKKITQSNCSQSENLMQILIQGENQVVICKSSFQ